MTAPAPTLRLGPICSWPECGQERRPGRPDAFCTMHRTRLGRGIDMQAPRLRKRSGAPHPTCYVQDCDKPSHSRGLCHGHLQRLLRGAELTAPMRTRVQGSLAVRLWRNVMKTEGCWLWQGTPDRHGYGWIGSGGRGSKKVAVHRASYELLVGPIPEGLHIDHLCRTPLCVNPSHLEPVTQAENNRRALPFVKPRPKRTHCPQGHPYSGDNLYIRPSGSYCCRTCNRERTRLRRAS